MRGKRVTPESDSREKLLQLCVPRIYLGSDDSAREALDALKPIIDRFILARTRDQELADSIYSCIYSKIWNGRRSFKFSGLGGWWFYLQRIVDSCLIDLNDRNNKQPETVELTDQDVAVGDELDGAWETLLSMRKLADRRWIGVPAKWSEKQRYRALLAAQLHYLEHLPYQEILDAVGTNSSIDRKKLDALLVMPHVLRDLAFHEIYISCQDLEPLVRASASKRIELNESHEYVLKYWIKFGMSKRMISERLGRSFDFSAFQDAVVELGPFFPFADITRSLMACLGSSSASRQEVLRPVWKRLAFEYKYFDDLSTAHLLERIGSAAEVLGERITLGVLNGWIDNKRLLTELIQFKSESGEQDE